MKFFNPKETPELDRLKLENEELKNRLHKVLADNDESTDLENKIAQMTEELSNMAKEEQRIEDFIKNATDEKVNKSKSVFDLNKRIGELAQEKEQLEENIKTLENKNSTLLQKQETYENNHSNLTSSIKEKENLLSELNSKFVKLNETATKLVQEIKREEVRVGGLIETSTGLTSQIKTNDKKVLELKEEIERNKILQANTEVNTETLQKSFKVLGKKKTKLLKEVSNLESKTKKSKEEHSIVSNQLKNDEEVRNSLQTTIAGLNIELNTKEKTFKDFTITKDKFIYEISQNRNELDSINFEIINKNEIISELEQEIVAVGNKKKEIEQYITNKKKTIIDVKRILLKKKEEEFGFDKHLKELKNNIAVLEEKKFKIEENILQLDSSFMDITKKLTEEINDSKSKLISIKQLILEKDRDFNKKEKTFLERNTQLAEYTGMVRLLRKEKDLLENQLNDLKNTKETLNENIISLIEKESTGKVNVNEYNLEIQDLITKRESISSELNSLLDSSYKNYNDYNEKNSLLINEIQNHESILASLSEKVIALELILAKLNEDISKADLEKEERSANISQLVVMEKSFKEKVETYKKELERIEEEILFDTQEPDLNIKVNKIKNGKVKLENNN